MAAGIVRETTRATEGQSAGSELEEAEMMEKKL